MRASHKPSWVLATAVLFGAALAVAAPDDKKDAPKAAASSSVSSGSAGAGSSPAPTYTSGYSPMPSNSSIPKKWLPPGADYPDNGPAAAIFPNQKLTVRFNHQKHVVGEKLACRYCHASAEKSTVAGDDLLPKKHDLCTDCHAIDEADPKKDDSPPARCDACHLNTKTNDKGAVVVQKLAIPTANLKMNHKAHFAKGIQCAECHGEVKNLELATRDQMPRMKGCFTCHQNGDAGGLGKTGGAKSECKTCHVTEKDGTLKTMFATGILLPPKWLKNSNHSADWIERHKKVAGADSGYCGSCHTEQYCVACHDGKVKPRSIHPNDWLNQHAIASRFDNPKCSSCHSQQNFCLPCHTRVGVANGSPSGVAATVRFHPDATIWSSPKRVPGHHSYEAQKNISACVSCHVERDCVVCHGTQGVGGQGSNPHGPSFINKCDSLFAKNPRPCFVCHEPQDSKLGACR